MTFTTPKLAGAVSVLLRHLIFRTTAELGPRGSSEVASRNSFQLETKP